VFFALVSIIGLVEPILLAFCENRGFKVGPHAHMIPRLTSILDLTTVLAVFKEHTNDGGQNRPFCAIELNQDTYQMKLLTSISRTH
jgi:hypothetical protein